MRAGRRWAEFRGKLIVHAGERIGDTNRKLVKRSADGNYISKAEVSWEAKKPAHDVGRFENSTRVISSGPIAA